MTGERSFVQVPIDSTGKKIRHEPFHRVQYAARVGNHIWQLQQDYQIYRASAPLFTVVIFTGPDSDSGYVGMKFPSGQDFNNVSLVLGDELWYNGSIVATIQGDEILHIPYMNISGGNSPQNTVDVDSTGSMSMRFDEGRPQLDAFGRLRVSSGTALGEYVFAYDQLPNDFSTLRVGNGTIGHSDDLRALELTCPSGAPGTTFENDSTFDQVAHTTNTYHHYFPGFSQTAMMTVALTADDYGTNVTRNWGYFDFNNGYMFRVDDNTNKLKLVIRSSATGSVQEKIIASDEFNGDPVDGTGLSQMNLRIQDDNIYWIDVQWLGAGRVRFGTYHRGQRIVIHEYYHEGTDNFGKPTSQTGSLPICFAMKNTGNNLNDAKIFAWCATVQTEHEIDLNTIGSNRLETITKTFDPTSLENGQDYELIGVLSPVKTLEAGSGGNINRTLYMPNYMEVMAYHQDGSEALVEFEVYLDPVLGGGDASYPINSDEFVANPGSTPWMVPVSQLPNNAVEVYKPNNYVLADRPKFWGGGAHMLSTYVRSKGFVDVNQTFNNFQDGAFKNYSENGSTEDHGVFSWTTGTTTSYSMPAVLRHREGYPIRLYDIVGSASTVLNFDENGGQDFYIKVTGINTAELYEDIEFTTAVNTQGLTITSNGRMRGDYGNQIYFTVVVKPLQPAIDFKTSNTSIGDITAHFNLGWSEINQ